MKLEDLVFSINNCPPDRRFQITPDNEWVYRKENYLEHRVNGYEVDLDDCKSSAAISDWLFQIYGKQWSTSKTIRDLMVHLQLRVNPQATLCSWGVEQGEGKKAGAA